VTKPLSTAVFEILRAKYKWVTTLTFLGHVTSSVTSPLDSPYPISYSSSIVTKPLSRALFEILGPKDNWVTTLTFLGHVTSSVTWPLDSPYLISYSSSIVTKPLSTALFEILGPKDNLVTTLTFLGHLTSSVTWPLDSPYPFPTLCSEKKTHSRFLLYLRGKCLDLHNIFSVCLWGIKYSTDIKIKYSLLSMT